MNATLPARPPAAQAAAPPHSRAAARRLPKAALLVVVLAALVGAALAALATPAQAAPQQPIMTLTRLSELLAASPTGTVPGWFLTTDKGAHIATIDCTVEGVVPEAADDNGSLIMFDATGDPIIDAIDGIADGMSGSPLYVTDPANHTDELVGAVSYGSEFTKGGLGLATPIEHMMTLESAISPDALRAAARTVTLKRPLTVGDTTVRTLVMAPTDAAARAARAGADTLVVRPLSSLTVSGLPASSPLFKTLNKILSAKGIQIRAGFDDQGAAGTEPDFSTDLVPGSALGYFFGWGDYSYGGIGTTTYTTDDNTLVAFGHPMLYDGQVSGFLTNADTIGLWGSLDEPTKMLAPGAIRGAITVDSGAGIAGVVGDDTIPAKVPLISTAYNDATPAAPPVSTTTYVTPYAIDQLNDPFPDLNASAFYPAMFQAVGDQYYDGHLDYELTVDVTDGTHDYTITRDNQWEDTTGVDAAFFAISDIYGILNQLNTDPDGTERPHHGDHPRLAPLAPAHARPHRRRHRRPRPQDRGEHGTRQPLSVRHTTPVTKDVTLNIPKGTSLGGSLYVVSPDLGYEDSGDGAFFDDSGGGPTGPPQTLGDVVAQIEGQYANNDMLVAYDPQQGYGVDDYGYSSNLPWSSKATTPVVTDMSEFLTGGVEKDLAAFQMFAFPSRIVAGEPVIAVGLLNAMGIGDDSVQIYKREAGQTTDTLVATAPLVQQGSDDGSDTNPYMFNALVANLRHNATITAVWAGNDQYLAASASAKVSVSPHIAFTVTKGAGGVLHFKASTSPASAGVIAFAQIRAHGYESLVKAVSEAHGRATATWRAPAGTYKLVALFRGNARNAAGASRTITVTVP